MALSQGLNVKFVTAVLFLTLHVTSSAKTNASPVYEVINEQSKTDEEEIKPVITSNPGSLPYGNPLAGNSQQNAKLHAHNQQAMFNAERIRQHKAQLQRWMKTPQLVDSYMRAYHESQESHQLALEQQQSNLKENKPKPARRREPLKRISKVQTDTAKSSKVVNSSVKSEKTRNHRSHGSVEYQQYLEAKKYQNAYTSPQATYGPEIAVKPIEFNVMDHSQLSSTLYGKDSPISEYIHPKYYSTQNYQSVQDILTLNSLLNKNPGDQLSEFNALISTAKDNIKSNDKELDRPIDLYFYLKDRSRLASTQHNDHTTYAQIASSQETIVKDHTPITEEVDDVEDPKETLRFNVQTIPAQQDNTATKNVQSFNPVATNHILSAGYNPLFQEEPYYLNEQEAKPTYQALQYGHQPTAYNNQDDVNAEEDLSERYLHHNAHKGVQHLADDGSGVSAYNEENLHYAANYEFGYRVRDLHSGNDFGHQEAKQGGETNGHYHVLLPDGRMQNVRYSAGPEGFHADISYDHLK